MTQQPFFLTTPGPMEAKQWGSFEDIQEENQIEISKESYSFSGFVGNENALLQLEQLLGIGCSNGGCILVTGCRGAGKTTLVNRAIYESGLLGRYDIDAEFSDPFSTLHMQLENNSKVKLRIKDDAPTLIIEVRVNVSSPISTDALIRRLVRSFYWSLVSAGIAGLIPELIETARLAYIRTMGEVDQEFESWLKETQQLAPSLKISSKDGLEVQIGAAAQTEIQIARKIAIRLGTGQKEELEEEILRLFDNLQGTTLGVKPSVWKRIGRVATWAKGAWDSICDAILGGSGLRVSLVVVFDELDKLTWEDKTESILQSKISKEGMISPDDFNKEKVTGVSNNVIELGPQTLKMITGARDQILNLMQTEDDVLRSAHGIASALKPILTNGQATFVFVGGTETANLWRKEQGIRDSILPSIFTDHVHIGLVDENYVKALLELNVKDWNGNWETDQKEEIKASLIYGLLYQSSGILKDLLVELRSIATKNERYRGAVDVNALKSIVEDPVFCQNAKKAFAVEYAINEYRSDKDTSPIAKRMPYRRDPSLLDDVKRAYYELVKGRIDENSISIEFGKLIHKGYINELPQLDAVAKVLAEFPGAPTLDYPEVMNMYEHIMAAVKSQWSSDYPSEDK